jgi:terminase small subunit-like protein
MNEAFRSKYARAREALMDFYAEQILVIAFDESGDILIDQDGSGGKSKAVANHAKVQRDRLKVDSLKWTASRLFPKRYGDKMELLGQPDEKGEEIVFRWEANESLPPPPNQEPPKRLQYHAPTPPADLDLSAEAWGHILQISELIKRIAPGEESPERVFGLIEGWLRKHYLDA